MINQATKAGEKVKALATFPGQFDVLAALIKIDTEMPESSTTESLADTDTHMQREKSVTEIINKYLFVCLTFTRLIFALRFSFYFSPFCFIECLPRHKTDPNSPSWCSEEGVADQGQTLSPSYVQEATSGDSCPHPARGSAYQGVA